MPESFKGSLEAWAAQLLDDYTKTVERLRAPGAKEFNDPIWGTILLRPHEVVVLDSPLVQRLRVIAQLGLVHLVYPAAGHSRFEHTLGVVHQITRLVASINEHFPGDDRAITERDHHVLRLTAICHDTGHGALSHVSENALQAFPQVEDIRLGFADEVGMENVPLAEVASYYLVGSPAFRKLLGVIQAKVPDHGLFPADETVDLMQKAIIGLPISDRVPLLHELISGPFDADKLDYMTRDAQMTGVPAVTDIPRLVQKVRAVPVGRDDLRPEIAQRVRGDQPYYVVTGIAFSGGRTVDELILSKTLQQDKLYRHHKVRAIESMVASIYQQLAAIKPDAVPMLPYRLTDHDFTTLSSARVAEVLGEEIPARATGQVAVALDLAARIARRDLFVRAYAFSLGMPLDPYRADPEHYAGLEKLARESGNDFPRRGALIDAIVEETIAALRVCRPELIEQYPDLKPYLWLDPLYASPKANDSARAYLISEHAGEQRVIRFQDDYAETVRWASAYLLTRDAGYIFAPEEIAPYAFVAAEKVLRRDYGIRTPQTMEIYAKQARDDILRIKTTLEADGFYKGIAFDARPVPARLGNADIKGRVDRLCSQFSGYEGPVRGGVVAKKASLLNPDRVLAWLQQFPTELGDEPLKMLEEIRLVGRHDVVAALDAFLAEDTGTFAGAALCPLGEPKDSSAVTTYWAGDHPSGHEVLMLGEALAIPDRPIIFVEDFIGSGQQSISILEGWLGVEPTVTLREVRAALDPATAQQLKERQAAFVFAAGDPRGASALRTRTEELCLRAAVHLMTDGVPQAFATSMTTARAALRDYCEKVGRALLLAPDEGHDEEWVAERALGYGNNAYLVVFGYNTPTQALSCIWKDGVFDGVPWTALFPRRPKR